MIIKFQIVKSVVIEAVKSATYLKAKIDTASDERAVKVGFNEAAGDDAVHESVLTHDFQTALEVVKTILAEYLVPNAQTIGDNIIYYNDKTDDIVEFVIDASRRCNGTLTDTLARLVSKYVEDYMLFQWWLKTTNQKQAEPYQASLAVDEQSIRRCFVLSGPVVPTVKYPTSLTASVDGEDSDGEVSLMTGEEATLSYSLSYGAVDDIEARSSDPSIIEIYRSREGFAFILAAKASGVCEVKLWSRHNDSLDFSCNVVVTERN